MSSEDESSSTGIEYWLAALGEGRRVSVHVTSDFIIDDIAFSAVEGEEVVDLEIAEHYAGYLVVYDETEFEISENCKVTYATIPSERRVVAGGERGDFNGVRG